MNKKSIIRILIPLLAVVVVAESVVLVSKLDSGNAVEVNKDMPSEVTPAQGKEQQPVADFVFETETREMKVGKSYKVTLSLVGKEEVVLNAIETYVKYDPEMLAVSNLVFGDGLPVFTDKSKIDSDVGMVNSIVLWENEGETYLVEPNKVTVVLSFMVTPIVEGETEISLFDGGEDPLRYPALLVESGTSDELLFLSNKLEINAVN